MPVNAIFPLPSPWRCSMDQPSSSMIRAVTMASAEIIALGAGRELVCVYTIRGTTEDPTRWIISLRKANKGESNAYRTAFPR